RKVGLPDKIWSQFPQMMSGGEQQRVAIARAMAAGGKILLADEPTGNLDSKNEENIVELLQNLAHIEKYVVIVITHNPVVAAKADVVLKLKDGELQRGEEND
ncbi:MAG: transporter ATP-binding protein, partial [Firmicutes bacterium]|nr:transporter ATP-binding protein [Bacillota bacterium]